MTARGLFMIAGQRRRAGEKAKKIGPIFTKIDRFLVCFLLFFYFNRKSKNKKRKLNLKLKPKTDAKENFPDLRPLIDIRQN